MNISRREFLQMLAVASASGISLTACENGSAQNKAAGIKPVDALLEE